MICGKIRYATQCLFFTKLCNELGIRSNFFYWLYCIYKRCLSVACPAADLSRWEAISAIVSLRSLSLARRKNRRLEVFF
jgi:hypothetical protein